eukprot:scaffold110633_cov21-Tisochrysis_lutea.AAC.2
MCRVVDVHSAAAKHMSTKGTEPQRKPCQRKERKEDYACQVWPRALRKGPVLKGRAPPHRPRGRGGTEVYTLQHMP